MTSIKRAIKTSVQAAIDDQHTEPFHIVKITFTSQTATLSESYPVEYVNEDYLEGSVRVNSFSWGPDGTQKGSITLLNENSNASALLLNNKVDDAIVEIYKVYHLPNGDNTKPTKLVKGVLTSSTIGASESTVGVVSSTSATEFAPRRFYTFTEGFEHLPPAGTVVTWNGEKYVLQGAVT